MSETLLVGVSALLVALSVFGQVMKPSGSKQATSFGVDQYTKSIAELTTLAKATLPDGIKEFKIVMEVQSYIIMIEVTPQKGVTVEQSKVA